MRNSRTLVIVAAPLVFLCSLAAWAFLTSGPRSGIVSTTASGTTPATKGAPILAIEGERVQPRQGQFTSEKTAQTDAADVEKNEVPTALQPEALKLAIESTLVGQMDPGGFLDVALALTALEVRMNPVPEADPSGAIRYPVLGTPEGVSAELWVGRTNNSTFDSPVLGYHITLLQPDGYVLEGAARHDLQAKITIWTDANGNPKNFGVLTTSPIMGNSRDLGLGFEGRKIPTGMLFNYDLGSPFEWTLRHGSFDDGNPQSEIDKTGIIHGQWPRSDGIDQLTSGLLNIHSKLK